jgi:hypothetical protein
MTSYLSTDIVDTDTDTDIVDIMSSGVSLNQHIPTVVYKLESNISI